MDVLANEVHMDLGLSKIDFENENQSNGDENTSVSTVKVASRQEKENDLHKSPSVELPLTQSPLVRTPPYEYIFLTKENEPKFRIYLNPRMDKLFQQEIENLKTTVTPIDLKPVLESKGELRPDKVLSHSERSLSSVTTKSSITIHCFDQSDVDLELKHIFLENPPMTHKIVRRRPRKERGSSVPGIDSYYGTQDLAKVGHASYFIPMLTVSERKAIGWKDEYCYGRWKYSTPNTQKSVSGLGRLRSTLSIRMNKSSQSHHSHNRTDASTAKPRNKPSNYSRLTSPISCGGSILSKPSVQVLKDSGVDEDEEDTHSYITLLPLSDNTIPSDQMESLRKKHILKRFFTWLVPSCIKKSNLKKRLDQGFDADDSCSSLSSENDCISITNLGENSTKTSITPSHNRHHHHHHTIGCFARHRHVCRSEIIGGDILASTNDSVASINFRSIDPNTTRRHEQDTPQPQTLPLHMGDEITVESLKNEAIETIYEIQEDSPQANASSLVVKLISVDNQDVKSVELNLASTQTQSAKKDKNENIDEATSISTVGYSAIPSVTDEAPSMQLSLSSFYPFMYGDSVGGGGTGDIDEDSLDVDSFNFTNEFEELPEDIYEFDPSTANNYASMPETRFLDLKDLTLPRYQINYPSDPAAVIDYYFNTENDTEQFVFSDSEADEENSYHDEENSNQTAEVENYCHYHGPNNESSASLSNNNHANLSSTRCSETPVEKQLDI